MRPSAKSFILDLLSTLRRGTMPVGALVEAAELFGIAGNNTRVALARLLAAGLVSRDEPGRYRLGEKTAPIERRVTSWRELERRTRSWDGGYLAVHPSAAAHSPGVARTERRDRERALRLFGFRALVPALLVRPDNLRLGCAELRAELQALGLPAADMVFEVRELDPRREEAARLLWDADELRAGYRRLAAELERSARHLARMPAGEAMVESFLVGGRAIRELVLDPLLPEEICPTGERQALVDALRRYDRLGRAAWAAFLKRFDVPHLRSPVDTRIGATPELFGHAEEART